MKRFTLCLCVALSAGVPTARPGDNRGPNAEAGSPFAVQVRPAPFIRFPGVSRLDKKNAVDCNSPAHWDGDKFFLFNSYAQPWRIETTDLFHLTPAVSTRMKGQADGRELESLFIWIESTWKDEKGALYAWYHYEPDDICKPNSHLPTAPKIGALRSADNGLHWEHLGVVVEAPPESNLCETKSPWDAGGHGDFTVIPDQKREHLYFFFSSYVKDFAEQGVAVARMSYRDRDRPVGNVFKWHEGKWKERGLGGRLTPILPAKIDWHRQDADIFWGPSVHWNTHLKTYVMLLNHAIDTAMKGDGTWVSFSDNPADPKGWSAPRQVLDAARVRAATEGAHPGNSQNHGWYPQVIGTGKGETDKQAGRVARLFIAGVSNLEILFLRAGEKAD
jgi:hypothetical protein